MMWVKIITIFWLVVILLTVSPIPLVASDCKEVQKACDELREIQNQEIKILEDVLVEEKLKNEELDTDLDHAKIWLWIIPPIGLLYTIFE